MATATKKKQSSKTAASQQKSKATPAKNKASVTTKKTPAKKATASKKKSTASKKKSTAPKKLAAERASTTMQAAGDKVSEEVQVLDQDIVSERIMEPGIVEDTILAEKTKPKIVPESCKANEKPVVRPMAPTAAKTSGAADRLAARKTRAQSRRVAKPMFLSRAARAASGNWKTVPLWTKVIVPLGIAVVMALFLALPSKSGETKASAQAEETKSLPAQESPVCGDVIEHTIELLPKAAKTVAMQETSTLVAQCERTSPGHRSCVLAAETSLDLAPCAQL